MTEWWRSRLCGLDLETTSADVETARIVTASVVQVGGGKPMESMTVLINPGVEIPQEAIDVHGITNERAQAEGLSPEAGIAAILMALDDFRLAEPGAALIVFNGPFDLSLLDREVRRHIPGLERPAETPFWVVDPMVIDRHLDRFRPKKVASRSLEDCCRLYDAVIDRSEGHSAVADALAAVRLAYRLAQRGEVVRRVRDAEEGREKAKLVREWESVRHDLPMLHSAQRRWFAQQAADREAYFRAGDPKNDRAPDPECVVPRDWPLIPLREKILPGA